MIANLPDGRVIALNRDSRRDRLGQEDRQAVNEFGTKERFNSAPITAEGKVIVANGAGDAGTRGWVAGARCPDRQRAVALVRRAGARRARQRDLEGQEQRLEDRRRRAVADRLIRSGDRSSRSGAPATRLPDLRSRWRARATTSTPTPAVALDINTGKLVWHFQYTPNDSWDYDEVGIHMLYDIIDQWRDAARSVATSAATASIYSLDRDNGSFIKGGQYVNELNWTKGSIPRPASRSNTIRSSTCRSTSRRRGRCAATGHEADLPDLARRRRVSADRLQPGQATSPTGSAPKAASPRTAMTAAFKGPDGGLDRAKFSQANLHQRSLLRLDDRLRRRQPQGHGEGGHRHRESAPARWPPPAALVFTALQDGWVVAYDDEKLEELWRFNVGTPLKGAPVTYAIGPKQYLAVQTSGRHLHPVKFDKLEHSSYLFVFRSTEAA